MQVLFTETNSRPTRCTILKLPIMPTKKPPLEKDIEKKICDYARSLNVLVYKFTSPNQRAVPDRMFIAPGGRIGFLEIKRTGCAPTKLQAKEMAKLKQQGCTVSWVDNVPDGKAFVAELVVQSQRGTPNGETPSPLPQAGEHVSFVSSVWAGEGWD